MPALGVSILILLAFGVVFLLAARQTSGTVRTVLMLLFWLTIISMIIVIVANSTGYSTHVVTDGPKPSIAR